MPVLNRITILHTLISEFSTSDAVKEVALSQYLFSSPPNIKHLWMHPVTCVFFFFLNIILWYIVLSPSIEQSTAPQM